MRAIAWTALFLALPGQARAQVNAENFAAAVDSPGWGLAGTVGHTQATGNVALFDLREQASAHWLTAFDEAPNDRTWMRDRVLLTVSGAHKSYSGDPVLNETLVHLRVTHMFQPRFGAEAYGQVSNDRVVLLDWRFVAGGNVRIVGVNAERGGIWGGSGYMAELELRDVPPGGPDAERVLNHRWNNYISWRVQIVPEALSWTNTAYIQPAFVDFGDLQTVDESSLDIAVTDVFGIRNAVRLRHDTRPPADLAELDLRFTTSFTFQLSGPKRAADEPEPAPEAESED